MTTTTRDDRRVPTKARVEHLTVAERVARGQAARADVPRSAHAEFDPGPERPDPVALLEGQAETRVPELVPIRYGRMLVSPFTFYRGAALIMAADLATTPTTRPARPALRRRPPVELRRLRHPGAAAWTSTSTTSTRPCRGRSSGTSSAWRPASRWPAATGASPTPTARRCSGPASRSYRTAMADFAGQSNLEIFYARLDIEEVFARYQATVPRKLVKRAEKGVAKARTKDSMQALAKLTHEVDGEPRISADPPLIVPIADLLPADEAERFSDWVHARLREYRRTLSTDRRRLLERYRFVDLARKVVGVGSVGTRAWIALMLGRDAARPPVPADQGGPALGARGVRRAQRVPQRRPPRGLRAAADAGGQRRLPGLGPRHRRPRRRRARLLRAPAARLEGLGRDRGDGAQGHAHLRRDVRLDPGPGPRPLGRPGGHRRLPRARATPSTGPSPRSRRPTPTATSATTRSSRRPWRAGG